MKSLVLFAGLWLALTGPARAADINISASADKARAELGETVLYKVQVSLTGYTQFSPQLQITPFDGFQVKGQPSQQQGFSWINGQVTNATTVTWELIPIKSGRLKLGPVTVRLKDPAQNEIIKQAPAVFVDVAKASATFLQPTPTLEPGASPAEDELRPLKPDLGFPWERLGLIVLGFSALLGLVLFLALRPAKPKPVEVVRNPDQIALVKLEEARYLLTTADARAYFKEVAKILKDYFRARLDLYQAEPTLLEIRARAKSRLKAPGPENQNILDLLEECFDLLVLVLFARYEPRDKDADQMGQWARNLVIEFEREIEAVEALSPERRASLRTKPKKR